MKQTMKPNVVLDRAHISSNSSYIKLENFEFEDISSSRKLNFSSSNLRLETSFGSYILSLSSFIEFEFLKDTNHQTMISLSLKLKK